MKINNNIERSILLMLKVHNNFYQSKIILVGKW